MTRIAVRLLAGLLVLAVLFYALDYAVWRVRLLGATGIDFAQVNRMSVAPLKGGKEEYYFDGTGSEACAVSLFPPFTLQGFATPCWWLRRHPQVVTRY